MSKGLLVTALVLLLTGLGISPQHPDAGADVLIAALATAILSINPVRGWVKGLFSDRSRRSKKSSTIRSLFMAAIVVFVVSLFAFGPVTTFGHITTGVSNIVKWGKKLPENVHKNSK